MWASVQSPQFFCGTGCSFRMVGVVSLAGTVLRDWNGSGLEP
jgi:hypothetical protein